MIEVSVTLHSARDGSKTELARLHICNDETGSQTLRNYFVRVLRGRSKRDLDELRVQREGQVKQWPALQVHVWNLVATALRNCGYGPGQRQH